MRRCPYCSFEFKMLAVVGDQVQQVPDLAPIICESCGGVALLVDGSIRRATREELALIKQSPAWREILEPISNLIRDSKAPPPDRTRITLTDGSPVTPDHREIDPATGMQKAYVVLSAEERARGFVRPVRSSYRHVGIRPKYPIRELTEEERERFKGIGYVAYEKYPDGSDALGRYWTEAQLKSGCGGVTTMGLALAETYARDPKFYGATFCSHCYKHFPVGEHGEFVWEGTDERVGT